jgi:hypothetical protein
MVYPGLELRDGPITVAYIAIAWLAGLMILWACALTESVLVVNVISITGALTGVVLLALLGLRGDNTRFFVFAGVAVFAFKCVLGYWFWTRFIMEAGPDNFVLAYGETENTNEFYGMINALLDAHRYWSTAGFTFTVTEDSVSTNHIMPVLLQALPIYFSNRDYPELTIPWNVFYSFITAYSAYYVCRAENIGERATRAVFLLVLLNPFSLLVATAQKDILAQTAMAVSLHAIMLSRHRPITQVFLILGAAYLMFNFRTPYFYLVVIFGVYYLAKGGRIRIKPEIVLMALTIFGGMFIVGLLLVPAVRGVFTEYAASFMQRNGLNVFYNVPFGLLTPFPWSQPFELGVEAYYQIPRYPSVVLDNALVLCVVMLIARNRREGRGTGLMASTVFGALFVSISFLVGRTHYEYVHPGMIFFAPFVLREGWSQFRSALGFSLGGMIFLNAIWIILTRLMDLKLSWTGF